MGSSIFRKKSTVNSINFKIIIIASIVLIMVIIGVVLIANNGHKDGDTEIIIPEVEASKTITNTSKNYTFKDSKNDVEMLIPQFDNLNNAFNSRMNNLIEADLNYKNVFSAVTIGIFDKSTIGKFYYRVTYDRYDCLDYISLVVHQDVRLGDENAMRYERYYNVNAKESTTAILQDVMENKTDYKRKIVQEIRDDAGRKGIEIAVNDSDITKLMEQNQSFYIKDDKLHVCFGASEIAANSYGNLDFEMPFTLKDGLFAY